MFSQVFVCPRGGVSVMETPRYGNVRVVRILLECILVCSRICSLAHCFEERTALQGLCCKLPDPCKNITEAVCFEDGSTVDGLNFVITLDKFIV